MTAPSIIFLLVCVLPLLIFVVWIMRQDKRYGWIAIGVLTVEIIRLVFYSHF